MQQFFIDNRQRGFTLVEVTVAAFIFSLILLVVLMLYETGHRSTVQGERASEMQQNTRIGFDSMMDELRMAGFDYDRDGDRTDYFDQPDEPLEYLAEHAVTIRSNLDHDNAVGGREASLEIDKTHPDWGTACCPIVTTGNDEIVTYALRSEDASKNTDSITVKLDTSTVRDAYIDGTGAIQNEETLTIEGIDLSGDNPPYELYRFVVNDDGDGFVETPVADDIHSLTFTYTDISGAEFYCRDQSAITCDLADRVDFDTLGGGDDITTGDGLARTARKQVRAVSVELVGMESHEDLKYKDPKADPNDAGDMASLHHRKFRLFSRITPPNLGRTGEPDLSTKVPDPPTNVTLCGGQCDTVRVEWDAPANASTYVIRLYDDTVSPPEPVFLQEVAGSEVPGSSPIRYYTVFDRNDDTDIADGRTLFARVAAKNSKGVESNFSLASDPVLLQDVVRPEAPPSFAATGYDPRDNDWPDTSVLAVESNANSPWYPKENKIVLLWDPPYWSLDVTDQTMPASSWTTEVSDTTLPAVSCDVAMADIDGDGVEDKERTPTREVKGNERFLIFRSTNPRFVPTDEDLIAVTAGEFDPNTGKIWWADDTEHIWNNEGDWVKTKSAVACCTDFYYRIRSADSCWSGDNPASTADAHLSPFYPPLNPANPSDTDDTSGITASQVALATPGWARADGKPMKPWDLRYTNGEIGGSHYWFNLRFRAPKEAYEPDVFGPTNIHDSAFQEYVVFAHPSDPNYTLNYNGEPTGEGHILGRITVSELEAELIARDDENQDGRIDNWEDETWSPQTGSSLRFRIGADKVRWVRLAAIQCQGDSLSADDDGDPYAYDLSEPSEAIKVPCDFGGGGDGTGATIDTSGWPDSVSVYATTGEGIYADKARLEISLPSTGESAMTDPPGITTDFWLSNSFTFDADHIFELTQRMSPGMPVYVSAEVRDDQGCYTFTNKTLETIGLPSCCLNTGDPVMATQNSGRDAVIQIQEKCNADPLTVTSIEFALGNENGGRSEAVRKVWWGNEVIWQGKKDIDTIDLSATPKHMGPQDTAQLLFEFSADVTLDRMEVRFVYDIGEGGGDCVFVEEQLD